MKSNAEWEKWGAEDPLFAVSTWAGKEKGGANPWTDKEFYDLGRSDGEDFIAAWDSFGRDKTHLLEIGCGAGRLTRFFSERFERISAVDVSEHQLAYARKHVDDARVHFIKSNGLDLPAETASVSALFSAHVFQHFDSKESAWRVFAEAYRVLAPGGTLMVHLPLFSLPQKPVALLLRRLMGTYDRLAAGKAWLGRRRGKLIMRMLDFDRDGLVAHLREVSFGRIEFRAFQVRSNGAWHDFVFAQK